MTACTQPRAGFDVAVECESVNAIVTTVISVVQREREEREREREEREREEREREERRERESVG